MRYWNVERFTGSMWLTTDYSVSGATEADAIAHAKGLATDAGWEDVRIGRELTGTERHRYCSFAWITVN